MIELSYLTPAAEQGWWTLFDLALDRPKAWVLVGGQMIYLLATEHNVELPRPTDDMDIVVDVRAEPGGTEQLATWLTNRGFTLEGTSPQGIGHRFIKPTESGPGKVIFDVLAPEGLSERTNIFTRRPARTVQAPGTVQALARAETVSVRTSGLSGAPAREGTVSRPTLLGALIAKAAATTIAIRKNPERDWQDAALLLSVITDPFSAASECTSKDRSRLRLLLPLRSREHIGWATLGDEAFRRGSASLAFLTHQQTQVVRNNSASSASNRTPC